MAEPVSSRTPEGDSGRCPVCGHLAVIEPSVPLRDAPCPSCGHLLWLNHSGSLDPVYTAAEAAKLCKVSMQTIVRSFDSGELSGYFAPQTRLRRIPQHNLFEFMDRHQIPRP